MTRQSADSRAAAQALQHLAREKMKLRLLEDIRFDLAVCEIEGWDMLEYIEELRQLINSLREGK